jgi:hypothetical protein
MKQIIKFQKIARLGGDVGHDTTGDQWTYSLSHPVDIELVEL